MYIQSNLFACQFLVFRPPFDLNAGGPSCTYTFSNSGCHALILGIIRSYRREAGIYIHLYSITLGITRFYRRGADIMT